MHHQFIPFDQLFLPPKETIVPRPQRIAPVEQLPPRRIIWFDETPSTHNLLKTSEYALLDPYTMVVARRQTAGRGQRGNSWESEDYRNLTFSMAATPGWLHPSAQFAISEATALAVVALLYEYGIEASVKWPNDIYVADRKICGILIDHSLQGMEIRHTVISAGLNVNQLRFVSDAPNPVSMLQLMPGDTPEFELEPIARRLQHLISYLVEMTRTAVGRARLHASFMQRLYRGDGGLYPFLDNRTGQHIQAAIADIAPGGLLTLRLPDNSTRTYAFKEVTFLINT
ncbi:MAG: biotin--[acetyl-CoA-carboxylase] ligase [Muribaculaceae bacterium]|nr:biotin--[acetyl-CoA-carboxylase] ligase [Muribaculaceae bacterium]